MFVQDSSKTEVRSLSQQWDYILLRLRLNHGPQKIHHWFGSVQIEPEQSNDSYVCLSAPTTFLVLWIKEHYLEELTEMWSLERDQSVRVQVTVRSRGKQLSVVKGSSQIVESRIIRVLKKKEVPTSEDPAMSDPSSIEDQSESTVDDEQSEVATMDIGSADDLKKYAIALIEKNGSLKIKVVQEIVGRKCNVSVKELKSASRKRIITKPRQIAMYLCRELDIENNSLPNIGNKFGNRDHTTVFHAYRIVESWRESDPEEFQKVSDLLSVLKQAAQQFRSQMES